MNKCYALVWNVSQGCWNVVSEGSRRRGKPAGAKAAIASALALLGATALAPAYALPTGGTVVGGSANGEIHLSGGNSLSVNQKVDKLIANWDSFSVAAGERVIFNQPSSSSIALNRVIGTKASDIQGRIDANGQVFLVNPNGVLFGRGAQVNVGGLVASTLDITDAEFNDNSSRYRFTGPSTNGVLNQGGAITAAEGGSIALLGAQVDNRGTVLAQMGGVGLGAGSDLTLNFDGNKLLDIRVDAGVANALASNGGLLKADGGRVLMAARTANALLNTVVNSQGAIEARSLRGKNGRIVLDGGPDGKVMVGGALSANALNGPGHGGTVEVRGQAVEVALGTQVNTLASNGLNGTWKIAADKIDVRPSAVSDGVTVHADTLSRNLASTNIELISTKGDLDLDGAVSWASGNRLGLGSAADLTLNGRLNASGAKAGLELKAEGAIDINDKIVLGGAGSALAMDAGEGHRVNGTASVSLAGANATYVSGGYYYTVVQNLAQLQAINKNLDGLYVLGGNILGGSYYCTALQSIGGPAGVFSGTLDGLGNSIGNLSISNTGPNVGLFAHSSGTLSNLKLNNLRVSDNTYGSGPSSLGALVGINSGRIANVSASRVSVVGSRLRSNALGGLVGRNINGQITNASVSGGVTAYAASTAVGGLVGENFTTAWGPEAVIENAHSNVHVAAQTTERNSLGGVGGLVGLNAKGIIRASGSQGKVETYRPGLNVGGLVGYNMFGHVSDSNASSLVKTGGGGECRWAGRPEFRRRDIPLAGERVGVQQWRPGDWRVDRQGRRQRQARKPESQRQRHGPGGGADLGGLVGNNSQGAIETAEATGKVSGGSNSRVGGLIGYNLGGSVAHAISRGDVSGGFNSLVGGLVGHNDGELVNVDASGRVSAAASASVGGLVGSNAGSILSARSSSTVSGGGRSRIGGLVGENQIQGRIVSSMSEGTVSGDYYVSMGGLAGVNLGSIEYSGVSGKIDFKPQSHYGQIYGAQVGENRGVLGGNYVIGEAALLPPAGIDYGNIW